MRRVVLLAAACVGVAGFAVPARAADSPPGNLGNGLARLLQPPAAKSGIQLTQAPLAIREREAGVLLDVDAREDGSRASVRDRAEAAGLDTVTQSADQRAVEGYVALS